MPYISPASSAAGTPLATPTEVANLPSFDALLASIGSSRHLTGAATRTMLPPIQVPYRPLSTGPAPITRPQESRGRSRSYTLPHTPRQYELEHCERYADRIQAIQEEEGRAIVNALAPDKIPPTARPLHCRSFSLPALPKQAPEASSKEPTQTPETPRQRVRTLAVSHSPDHHSPLAMSPPMTPRAMQHVHFASLPAHYHSEYFDFHRAHTGQSDLFGGAGQRHVPLPAVFGDSESSDVSDLDEGDETRKSYGARHSDRTLHPPRNSRGLVKVPSLPRLPGLKGAFVRS